MARVMVSCSIGQGDPSDFTGYLEQHQLSITCANLTLDHLGEDVRIWHRHIDDLRAAMGGGDSLQVDGAIPRHQRFALRLEAGALSTSKAALDCCLGGLYVQGVLLTRHLFETWQAIAYALLDPHGAQSRLDPTGTVTIPPDREAVRRAPQLSQSSVVGGAGGKGARRSRSARALPQGHGTWRRHPTRWRVRCRQGPRVDPVRRDRADAHSPGASSPPAARAGLDRATFCDGDGDEGTVPGAPDQGGGQGAGVTAGHCRPARCRSCAGPGDGICL